MGFFDGIQRTKWQEFGCKGLKRISQRPPIQQILRNLRTLLIPFGKARYVPRRCLGGRVR